MATRRFNVLFLCTGNSARSIIAEALLRSLGGERFGAFSAGSRPVGAVNALALEVLARAGIATAGLHSKGFEAFVDSDAPSLDLVVTVCDAAAGDSCPVWRGAPARAHWSLPDPAAATGSADERRRAFDATLAAVRLRVERLVALVGAHPEVHESADLGTTVTAINDHVDLASVTRHG